MSKCRDIFEKYIKNLINGICVVEMQMQAQNAAEDKIVVYIFYFYYWKDFFIILIIKWIIFILYKNILVQNFCQKACLLHSFLM